MNLLSLASTYKKSAGVAAAGGAAPGIYVATNGNDTTGNGTSAAPYLTIGKAISVMASGDTVIVKDGTYSGTANFIDGMPGGISSAQPTIIKAENPFGARIQNGGSLGYQENMIQIGTSSVPAKSYVKVDGFIIDHANSLYPPHSVAIYGSYNRITRCIVKRSGVCDDYGGWFVTYGSNNLLEDCAGVGSARYGFEQGGPTETTQFNIRRRCVGRLDYSGSTQPKRTFTSYGNDTGTGVADNIDQNCIAIDGGDTETGRAGTAGVNWEPKYSSLGCGKEATRILQKGCISVHDYAYYAGVWISTTGYDCAVTDCAVWGLQGPASTSFRADNSSRRPVCDHVTTDVGLTNDYEVDGLPATPTNSKTSGTPTDILNNTPGAVIMKRRGTSGALYGEAGYDTLTTDDLWPYPYQANIKSVFAETNASPGAPYYPTSNTTTRGFCAAGNGLYGGAITLSSYIWEITGTACPSQYAA